MTRAVRIALAASVTALALGGSGAAFAAGCGPAQVAAVTQCAPASDFDRAPVVDLTTVHEAMPVGVVPAAAPPIDQYSDSDVVIDNTSPITAVYSFGGTAISGYSSGGNVDITNHVGADLVAGGDFFAYGIYGGTYAGDVGIGNDAGISVSTQYGLAAGILGASYSGNIGITNTGAITATSTSGDATGLSARVGGYGQENPQLTTGPAPVGGYTGGIDISNTGNITATSTYGDATGMYASVGSGSGRQGPPEFTSGPAPVGGYGGGIDIDNSGDISAISTYGDATGIYARISGSGNYYYYYSAPRLDATSPAAAGAYVGGIDIDNSGDITAATTYGDATGIYASINGSGSYYYYNAPSLDVTAPALGGVYSGGIDITNSGAITAVTTYGNATGIYAYIYGYTGDVGIDNTGAITAVTTYGNATGITAYAYTGDAGIDNTGAITAVTTYGNATGIGATAYIGNVDIDNTGAITAVTTYGYATGLRGYTYTGNVAIGNTGDITAVSTYYNAVGIYGYAYAGNVGVDNTGDILAVTTYGVADGIFAAGVDVDVTNGGAITAVSNEYWASGIEAEGSGQTTIHNNGDINAYSSNGHAYGIYATGAGVTVDNTADIVVQGYYATGIHAQSYGDVTVTNTGGSVTAGSLTGSALATGIDASTNGTGAAASVVNSGDVAVRGYYGSNGIVVSSAGTGGTANVTNTGTIYAAQYGYGAYGAYGILATADGDVGIDNAAGTITALSNGNATGAVASSFNGDADATNTGAITAVSFARGYYGASGLVSFSANGNATVDNGGSVVAASNYISYALDAQGLGDVTVDNGGSAYANGLLAFGVHAVAGNGDTYVHNSAGGSVGFYSYLYRGFGVFAASSAGDVDVVNDGTISGYAYDQSVGVFAVASVGDASVSNTGVISTITGGDAAVAVFARADGGTASVSNIGDVHASVHGVNGYIGDAAYGIVARGAYAQVANSGAIDVDGQLYSAGIVANSQYGSSVVTTGGSIQVYGLGIYVNNYGAYPGGSATGIDANTEYGNTVVSNVGTIEVGAYGADATGISATALYDVNVVNSGDIAASSVYGYATGINAAASSYTDGKYATYMDGTTSVSNSGDISLVAPAAGSGKAFGINATRYTGDVVVANNGDIDISAGGRSYGIYAHTKYGNVSVTNTGDITMQSPTDAQIGIQASTGTFFDGGGDVSIINTGDISVHSDYGFANGIGAVAGSVQNPYGNSYIGNAGDIDVFGQYFAAGIQTRASDGTATIVNVGDVDVSTGAYFDSYDPGSAQGISVLSFYGGDLTIQNAGDVAVHGYAHAYGLYAKASGDGDVSITNAGDVSATTESTFADGVFAYSYYGDVEVNNAAAGSIDASGGVVSTGIQAVSAYGNVVVNNDGTVHAGGANYAAAVAMYSYAGTSTLNNGSSGYISVDGTPGQAWAVFGSDAVDTINNAGTIAGSINLSGGDDTINNAAGGTLVLDSASILLGDSDTGNAFNNDGTIVVSGDSLIDMGSGGVEEVESGSSNELAASSAPPLNPAPLMNLGTVDFLDGATDDMLTILGDLGGEGALNIDVSLLNGTADQLYVDGNIADGAVQHVNVVFDTYPAEPFDPIPFAHVTGDSTAGSFVGGQLVGYDPANFLDLQVAVLSEIDDSNATPDVFSVGVAVAGLDDPGTTAASIATGAAGLANSQMGTFRQRLGVNPYGDSGKVLSGFVRFYGDQGDVDPTHNALNFGQSGNFAYDQSNNGREVGMNANLFGNFHAGLVLGHAEASQHMAGAGSNHMDGMTWGAYATWYVPNGFYVDLTGRWMKVDVHSTSPTGTLPTSAHVSSASIEAGYQWTFGNGWNLVPQAQYTRTDVKHILTLHGPQVDFQLQGATFSRARLGVEVNKTFQAGGMTLTPYATLSAVREFDGDSHYIVAGAFYGNTSVEGTSGMAEFGLGVQKGGWGFTLGANWTDGGAYDSQFGGQAIVRFAW